MADRQLAVAQLPAREMEELGRRYSHFFGKANIMSCTKLALIGDGLFGFCAIAVTIYLLFLMPAYRPMLYVYLAFTVVTLIGCCLAGMLATRMTNANFALVHAGTSALLPIETAAFGAILLVKFLCDDPADWHEMIYAKCEDLKDQFSCAVLEEKQIATAMLICAIVMLIVKCPWDCWQFEVAFDLWRYLHQLKRLKQKSMMVVQQQQFQTAVVPQPLNPLDPDNFFTPRTHPQTAPPQLQQPLRAGQNNMITMCPADGHVRTVM